MDITPQKVLVVDAQGAAPTIPFWKGDQIGRTYELGMRVNKLYDELRARLDEPGALEWLRREYLLDGYIFILGRSATPPPLCGCDLVTRLAKTPLNLSGKPSDCRLAFAAARQG